MDLDFNAAGELHLVHTVKILVTGAGRLSARCTRQYHLERVPGSTENLKVLFEISVFVQHPALFSEYLALSVSQCVAVNLQVHKI